MSRDGRLYQHPKFSASQEMQHIPSSPQQLRRTSRKAVRPLPPGMTAESIEEMIRNILAEPEFRERLGR